MDENLTEGGNERSSRRDFLKASTAAGVGALAIARSAHAAGSDEIKIALIGCGGRGTGATVNALSTKANVKLVAMADVFRDRLDSSLRSILGKPCKDRVDVPEERKFIGLDAYQQAIDSDVDMVLLCTPPGFRPIHFEAAVKAGKHVFMEKPVATDAPGVRKVLETNKVAKQKGLAVAVGHHLRHEVKYREVVKRIHDGAIGALQYLRAYFTTGPLWVREREPNQTELQFQVRDWYYFTWLSGDHIVEQHVHDLDVCNWIKGAHPVEAQGMGGRQVRIGPDFGEIFDHHCVEFTYTDGVKMFSFCRQTPGCWNSFSQHARGDQGVASMSGFGNVVLRPRGQDPVRWRRGKPGHQLEHDDLFAALTAGEPYNEGDYGATSTMTAILGRMASYSGKVVPWDEALKSDLDLMPKTTSWDDIPLVLPDEKGLYACATPGVTRAW